MRRREIHLAENFRRLLPQSRYDDQDAKWRVVIASITSQLPTMMRRDVKPTACRGTSGIGPLAARFLRRGGTKLARGGKSIKRGIVYRLPKCF